MYGTIVSSGTSTTRLPVNEGVATSVALHVVSSRLPLASGHGSSGRRLSAACC